MISAQATYLALMAALGWIFRQPRNCPLACGAERFRVSERVRWGVFVIGIAFAAASLTAMLLTERRYELGIVFLLAMADVLSIGLLYFFFAYRAVVIDVDDDGVTLVTLFRQRRYPNSSIRRVVTTIGAAVKTSGGRRATLYDERGRRILEMDPRFPDVDRFLVLMKLNLSGTATFSERQYL